MTKIIFATGNQGKVNEIREILKDLDAEVVTMKEAGIDIDVDENGSTYEENAILKAKAIMEASGQLTLADDSVIVTHVPFNIFVTIETKM